MRLTRLGRKCLVMTSYGCSGFIAGYVLALLILTYPDEIKEGFEKYKENLSFPTPSILCWVDDQDDELGVIGIRRTWGLHCDRIEFHRSSEQFFSAKIRNFDWIVKANSKSYIDVDNLKTSLRKLSSSMPIIAGQALWSDKDRDEKAVDYKESIFFINRVAFEKMKDVIYYNKECYEEKLTYLNAFGSCLKKAGISVKDFNSNSVMMSPIFLQSLIDRFNNPFGKYDEEELMPGTIRKLSELSLDNHYISSLGVPEACQYDQYFMTKRLQIAKSQ